MSAESWALPDLLAQTQGDGFTWAPLRPGVEQHTLYGSLAGSGPVAAIVRYAPGAQIPYHRHDGYEHLYVLAGSQRDQRGTYRAGDLVINPPGSAHDVVSDHGCTVLLIWERPVVFVDR